jgi:MoaA/NifB/PqqE/SkfB family radical SAM enzyme
MTATTVAIGRRLDLPELPEVAVGARHRRRRDQLRLAAFFARLAVKERLAPRLHVRPLVGELFMTDNCNLRCVSCHCWREHTRGELTTAEWCSVIDQLADLRFLKLNFTGGEPLLRRDVVGLLARASNAGIPELHLNTNALLLDDRRLDAVLGAGVRSFNISVDGPTPDVHDAIRGKDGAFETTIGRIHTLLARRDELDLQVRMNFTVLRDNVAHLPAIAALAQDLGVRLYLNLGSDQTFLFRDTDVADHVHVDRAVLDESLRQLQAMIRSDGRWLPRFSDLRYIPGHFSDIVQRDLPCAESQLKLMVHSTGEVGGCWGHDADTNVRDHSLADLIDGEAYREQHARLFRKDCVGCGSNYSLNLRWRPTTYWRDLRFRAGREELVA